MTAALLVRHEAAQVRDEVLVDQLTRHLHAQVSVRWTPEGRWFSTEGASVAQMEAAASFWLPTVPWRVFEVTPARPGDGPRLPVGFDPSCQRCNLALHHCPGCGDDVPHGVVACGTCDDMSARAQCPTCAAGTHEGVLDDGTCTCCDQAVPS